MSESPLDKVSNKTDWFIAICQQRLWLADNESWKPHTFDDVEQYIDDSTVMIPVGQYQGATCFTFEAKAEPETFTHFRSQLPVLNDELWMLASRAMQLNTWWQQHQFCGQCGKPTEGHSIDLACYCKSCDLTFYPRVSPCIMCLIVKGDECLLAHHHRQPEGMYSTLAGFVEAGESLEQTLHREVFEEVGVKIGEPEYFSSQPWPFPHQLMVGFIAEYESGDIRLEEAEIADAQWFRYDQLPMTPPADTLSGRLIEHFIQQRTKKNER